MVYADLYKFTQMNSVVEKEGLGRPVLQRGDCGYWWLLDGLAKIALSANRCD